MRMKIGFTRFSINPVQPVAAFRKGIRQKLSEVRDELSCTMAVFSNEEKLYLLLSCPVADIKIQTRGRILAQIRHELGEKVHLTFAATHTHYGANINADEAYARFVGEKIVEAVRSLVLVEYSDLTCSFRYEHFDRVGISRISGQPTDNVFVETLSIANAGTRLATLIIYNSHPTTLSFKEPYLSSVGPGMVVRTLEERHAGECFLYFMGAAGDISTRFTRRNQSYEEVQRLAGLVTQEVERLLCTEQERCPIADFCLEEVNLPIRRVVPKAYSMEIPDGLSPRELETIQKRRLNDPPAALDQLPKSVLFQRLILGNHSIIFAPFELFSEYLDFISRERASIVGCANDHDCYLTGRSQKRLTMEMFEETVSDDSKADVIALLQKWGNPDAQ